MKGNECVSLLSYGADVIFVCNTVLIKIFEVNIRPK
jgi:hypothetical protein